MGRIFMIANPNAGHGRIRRWVAQACRQCQRMGLEHEVQETLHPGHAHVLTKQAVASGWPIVAVFGGDGTIHEVVNALVGSDVPLAVFPCGTGNDFARSLEIPTRFGSAFRALHQGSIRTVDLGHANGYYFANMLGIGFSVDVVKRASALHLGSASFFVAVYQSLRARQTYRLEVRLDGELLRLDTLSFHLNNNIYSGGGMAFAPMADPTDGWLDVGWVENISAWKFASLFPHMYRPKGVHHPAYRRRRAKRISIHTEHPLPVMCDGELVGHTPLRVQVAPNALRVLVPGWETIE